LQLSQISAVDAIAFVFNLRAISQAGRRGFESRLHPRFPEWGPLARTLDFAQRFTAAIDFAALDRSRFILDRTHAFADPNEADAAGIRLILPAPEILADAGRQ